MEIIYGQGGRTIDSVIRIFVDHEIIELMTETCITSRTCCRGGLGSGDGHLAVDGEVVIVHFFLMKLSLGRGCLVHGLVLDAWFH